MNRKWTRRIFASVAATAAATLAAMSLGAAPAQAEGVIFDANQADSVEGSYIVVMKDAYGASAQSLATSYGGSVDATFASINGFSVSMSESDARKLAADPAVEYVQQDAVVSLDATQLNPPSWGLDRIDQHYLPYDNSYTFPDSAGAGVRAYVIDTGVDLDHPEFVGRISSGIDTVDGDMVAEDCNGHGTHVAGTVGGTQFGVAKKAHIVAVRVLDCNGSGTLAGIIKGVDWVTNDAASALRPAVANMSLGGGYSLPLNQAVETSIDRNITYAVAAGNDYGYDACNVSPASAPSAITVGATDINDNRAGFSNIGPCVDIFAPGVNIASAWLNGGSNTISGTSMASPHVAGAAALQLGENPGATPAQVAAALGSNATANVVGNPGTGSPNLLLYTGYLNQVDDFSLSISPSAGAVVEGEQVTLTAQLSTTTTSGSPQTVTFGLSGAPNGLMAGVMPGSVVTGNTATLTLNTTALATVAPGVYTITVTAYGSMVSHSVDYTLVVLGA